jgi:hypothetical protein
VVYCFAHEWILLVFSSTTGGKPARDIHKINELFFTIREGISPDGPFCLVSLSAPDYDGGHLTRAGKMA